ncbi:MAG: Flp family type IVb pilin [Desulfobulbaceae bacterium]|nr:Flp family type IVb pilin [Desulfobulbaceae bacterium]
MKALEIYLKMKALLKNEEGVTAIEYGLIAALVAVVLVGVLTILGGSLQDIFQYIANALDNAQVTDTST